MVNVGRRLPAVLGSGESPQTSNSQFQSSNVPSFHIQRIEKARLKVRYTFGMPPHRAEGDIIHLGEFQMEISPFTPQTEE